MNKIHFPLLLAATLLINACSNKSQTADNSHAQALQNLYFGEEPPGLVPKLFDPKTVSPEGLFEGGAFSPDLKEYYFTRMDQNYEKRSFFVIYNENGIWGNESETDIRWPHFSEDGTMMYGGKWYRERTENGWSELKNQGEFLKDQAHGISRSSKGTYFLGAYRKEDNGPSSLSYSRFINGKYENPVKMSEEINTGKWIAHPFIASDESYLMWDAEREEGHGDNDCYISFRQRDGSWGAAINLGAQINTSSNESSPRVTLDGKYLFFSRGDWKSREDGSTYWVGKTYWVDVQIIENLRPKN
ncbi:MAG: hypothetical protein HEP71_24690 [Roseivirga sp.]|nr:hypothetical protein [Roseivirga sp.]